MRRNYFIVGIVFLTFFVLSFLTNILGPIIPDIIDSFHVSLAAAAFLPFSFFLAYGVLSVPAGFLVDRFTEKPVMIASAGNLTFWRLTPGGVIARSTDGIHWRPLNSGTTNDLFAGAAPSAQQPRCGDRRCDRRTARDAAGAHVLHLHDGLLPADRRRHAAVGLPAAAARPAAVPLSLPADDLRRAARERYGLRTRHK